MKILKYQQEAVGEIVDKTIKLLNVGGTRRKIVFEAPTGAGKTVMACQAMAEIVDELRTRTGCRYRECAFIWFAPRKLHLQSYAGIKEAFGETRKLSPVMFDEVDQSEGIGAGEILFVNWESINKQNNVMVRDSESSVSLYEVTRRTKQESGLPIIAIIDEEHMFWSATADKTRAVLDRIDPDVEIRISATPKTVHPDESVKVYRQEVIAAGMIKKEVVLNPEIDVDSSPDELTLNERLIKAALARRTQLADAYRTANAGINPLLLIQLPNDRSETMTSEDTAVANQVREYLRKACDITEQNGRLAVWLAGEKTNLEGLEQPDNMVQVMLFKEAVALGWDCPRAAVLLIFRKLQSDCFTVQTVGRIMRMPEQHHYTNEILNRGYVYTDIAKDKIEVVAADADYILDNTLTANRREGLRNVSLRAVYTERPNIGRNYLGPDFRQVLYDTAVEMWNLENTPQLFSLAEMEAMEDDGGESLPAQSHDDSTVKANRHKVKNMLRLDVGTINIRIPKDVYFHNDVQTLEVEQARFARTESEIDSVFTAYIDSKGSQFERRGRTDKIAGYLTEFITESFGIYGTEAKKTVLYHSNRPYFDRMLERALERYARRRHDAAEKAASQTFAEYVWEVPQQRIYDAATNHEVGSAVNHALMPFVRLNNSSNPEKEFVAFLESNGEHIDWWYKNGDSGKQHFAIGYTKHDSGEQALFYVDFIIRMKSGRVCLFDTKSVGSDMYAADKHNALAEYAQANSTAGQPLTGGVIIRQGDNWLYPPQPIGNTVDTTEWELFLPERM